MERKRGNGGWSLKSSISGFWEEGDGKSLISFDYSASLVNSLAAFSFNATCSLEQDIFNSSLVW